MARVKPAAVDRLSLRRFRLQLGKVLPPALFLIVVGVFFFTDLVKVTEVLCQQGGGDCTPRHWEILNLQKGKLILFLKPNTIATLLEEDPSIKSAKVTTKFPHTLSAELETESRLITLGFIPVDREVLGQPPVSSDSAAAVLRELEAIKTPATGWFQLNAQGELLPTTERKTNYVLGDQPSQSLLVRFYELYTLLEREGLGLAKYWLYRDHVGLVSLEGTTVFLNLNDDLFATVRSLQQILATTTIDLTHAVVDLRFKNPVVVRQ